jgi:predicted phage-related endonuclease
MHGLVPRTVEENEAMRWGKLLEHPIRLHYSDLTGREVSVPKESLFHKADAWKRATPDGIIVDKATGRWARGLEIKTASPYLSHEWGDAGTDQVPVQYTVQCMWSMHVTGVDLWDLAVLIGGRDFRLYHLRRDVAAEAALVAEVTAFYTDSVLGGVEPDNDGTKEWREYRNRRWPHARDVFLPATSEQETLVASILARRAIVAELEELNDVDANELCRGIGDASGLTTSLGKVHWKPQRPRKLVDWKAVAADIAKRTNMSDAFLSDLAASFTTESKSSRPLRLPRNAATKDSE